MRKICKIFIVFVCFNIVMRVSAEDVILSAIDAYDAAEDKRAAGERFINLLKEDGFIDDTDDGISLKPGAPQDSIDLVVWYWSGEYLYDLQEYDRVKYYINKALPLCNNEEQRADCYSLLSIIHFRKAEYAVAIDYAKKTLEIYRKSGDKSRISTPLNTISAIYLAAKQPEQAEKYILEAIENSTAAADTNRVAIQCGIASEIYHAMGKNERALEYATRAYTIDSIRGNHAKLGIRLSQMATPQIDLGMTAEAEALLKKAIPLLEQYNQIVSLAICYNQMGALLNMKGAHTLAAEYYQKSLDISTERRDLYSESKSRLGMYEALKESNPREALSHLNRYAELKDSLYQQDMKKAIQEYDAKFRNEELAMQNRHEKIEKQQILIVAIAVVSILLIFMAFLFYRYLLRKKRQMMQKELLESKEIFFTNITHEFRTPLTIIQAAAQDILTSCSTTGSSDSESEAKKSQELCENAQDIIRNGESLLSLINEILEVARLSSGKTLSSPAMQHADIVAYITMTCQSFKPLAEAKDICLSYATSCEEYEMDFSPDYIKKILQNLISNAVKYSEPGGSVEISSRVSGDNFVLTVSDQGIGMDEKAAEKAFQPFFRVADSKEVGTGVGLSVVKLSVEALGGTISLDTAPGKGSTFTISLPITHNAEPQSIKDIKSVEVDAGVQEVEVTGDGAKILIVEDTPEVAKYIQKQLSHDNYAFYFAKNGEEGLRQALEVQPDIIITDVMMPVSDGYELSRKVRENEMLCHIPIIMVTAKITHESRVRGLEAGADAYLEKPFHEDELRVRVGKLIEHNRRLRELYSQAIECDEAPKAKEVSAADSEFLGRVTEKFQANMADGKIDYDAFASDLCITRVQLNRKIKAITGYTTTEYLLLLRLKHAKELLKTTDLPIVEVALECGVDNISYFGSLFKKHVGVTPMQYRGKV